MKKFLSLVLALVMTMSLVTVSAGAKEFKDDADVTYDEAVAVISEVGVVDGYEDGSFKPGNTLTRGAAAKIICNLILGPTTAAELRADTAPYKDVPVSNTFSGYIAYCAKEGIISGYADGSFRPAGTLTGYAFMKMLLGALGYDSENEGYTGANWSINVAKQAIGIGLNAGLADEFNGVDFVTREEAALYAFNTLKATMVDYEQKITTNINGVEVVISQGNEKPVTWTEGKNNDGNIKDDGFVQFAEEFFPKLVRKDDSTKFEEPANTWVNDKTEIGTYERTDLLVETYTTGVSGRDVYDLLKSGVVKDNDFESYLDGGKGNIKQEDLSRANEKDLADTGNGVVTKVYLNTDKDLITIVSINTWLAQATGDYSESKEYAPIKVFTGKDQTASYNVDVEDVANVVDVKNDTFYQVNISYKNGTRGEVVVVAPVEVLEDSTVTKFSADKGEVTKLTTGGEEYKANVKACYDKDVLHEYDENLLTDNTYNVFVDANGYFLGVELFEGTKNYVFITGYDRPTSNLSVKTADAAAIFLDGTMEQIKVNVKDTNSNIADLDATEGAKAYFQEWAAGGEYAHNRWYTYTKTEAGVYTLKPCARMTATDYTVDTTLNTANLRVSDNVESANKANVYGEDATVFLTVDLDEVDTTLPLPTTKRAITEVTGVYTGVQEVDLEIDPGTEIEEAEVYTVYDSDYFIIGAIVVGEGKGTAANIAYILDGAKSEEYKDGTYYWEFECVMDGQVQTLTAKSKYVETIRALRSDKDGIVELRFDGEYVVNVKDVKDIYNENHFDKSDATGKPTYDISDFDVYDVKKGNELSLQGRTLYVLSNQDDNGLALAKDAKAVVIQDENNKTDVKTEFTSVDAAKNYLADADTRKPGLQYKGRIIAALDSTGAAAWVVFDSDTKLTSGSEQPGDGGQDPSGLLDYTVRNLNGYAFANFTVRTPEYASDGSTVSYTVEILADGIVIDSISDSFAANDGSDKGAWQGPVFDEKANVTLNLKSVSVDGVAVKYVDGETGSTLFLNSWNSTADVNTGKLTVASGNDWMGSSAKQLKFTVKTDDATSNKLAYTLAGTKSDVNDKTALSGNANAEQTIPAVATTAKGDQFVVVTIYGMNDLTETYDVKVADSGSGKADSMVFNTFKAASGEAGSVNLTITQANAPTGVAAGYVYDLSDITVALSEAPAKAYAYRVTIAGFGSVVLDANTYSKTLTGSITVDKDITITKDMVTVEVVENLLAVTGARWNDHTVTLTFNEDVDKTTGETVANYSWAKGSGNGTSSANPMTAEVRGKTVVLTFSGDALEATNTITLTTSILKDGTAGSDKNESAAQVITLDANGAATVAPRV